MSDIGDDFKYLRDRSREKRQDNRESSPAILTDRGVSYSSHNGGAHLVVSHQGQTVDFWPGTGKWIARDPKKTLGRGVFSLLRFLKVSESTRLKQD